MRARSLIAEQPRPSHFDDETTSARVRNTLADALAELEAQVELDSQVEEVDLDALPVPRELPPQPTRPLRSSK
jgi:hypothetical protein